MEREGKREDIDGSEIRGWRGAEANKRKEERGEGRRGSRGEKRGRVEGEVRGGKQEGE